METAFSVLSHASYITPLSSIFYIVLRFLGVQHLLHHPELYKESNFEQSWQSYVDNMARQGTWADNIIIQPVANSLNVTTGTQFNVITYYLIGDL